MRPRSRAMPDWPRSRGSRGSTRSPEPMSPFSASRSIPASATGPAPASTRPHPGLVEAAPALQPGSGRLPVRCAAGGRRGRCGGQPVRFERGRAADRNGGDRRPRRRGHGAHPRRRPHHRATDTALVVARSRPDRRAALRRPPRHLEHILRGAVHPRHAVSASQRGGPARPRALPTHGDPRAAVHRHRPGGRRPARLLDRPRRRLSDRRRARSSGADAAAARRRAVYVSIDIDVLDPAHALVRVRPRPAG